MDALGETLHPWELDVRSKSPPATGACVQRLLRAWEPAYSVSGACQERCARIGWEKLSRWQRS